MASITPVPSVGLVDVGAQGTPSKVAEHLAMVMITLPTMGKMGLLTMLVALTMVGMTQPVRTSLT